MTVDDNEANLSQMLQCCSGPHWNENLGAIEEGFRELLRLASQGLQDQVRAVSAGNSPAATAALGGCLKRLAANNLLRRRTWTPAVAGAFQATRSTDCDAVTKAAAELVLAFPESAAPFSWELRFDKPIALRVGWRVTPLTRQLRVICEAGRLRAWTDDWQDSWELEGPSPNSGGLIRSSSTANTPETGYPILMESEIREYFSMPPCSDALDADQAHTKVLNALRLLSKAAPEYVAWIAPVVHVLLPVGSSPGEFASGSAESLPGVIVASFEGPPAQLAESLVHESAHQYYFFLQHMGPLIDSEDHRLYYSALARRKRPLSMILAAWHAAANVVCLHALLLRAAPEEAPAPADVHRAIEDYHQLSAPLKNSPALTSVGRTLFEPMQGWIDQRGLA